jgi:hypothetical protein
MPIRRRIAFASRRFFSLCVAEAAAAARGVEVGEISEPRLEDRARQSSPRVTSEVSSSWISSTMTKPWTLVAISRHHCKAASVPLFLEHPKRLFL